MEYGSIIILLVVLILVVLLKFRPRTQMIVAEQISTPRTPVYMFVCPEREIAQIAPTVERLRIQVSDGNVKVVRRSDISQISVRSNYKGNWSINGGTIEQHNDPTSLWRSESGQYKLQSWTGASKEEVPSYKVSVNGDKVTLDGKEIRVIFEDDTLEIAVPDSFRGDIEIDSSDGGKIDLSGWKNGGVELSSSSGSLSVEDLGEINSLTVTLTGDAAVAFGEIECNGNVSVETEEGDFASSDIRASGSLSITTTRGNISLETVKAGGNITITSEDGNVTTGDVTSVEGEVLVTTTGYGDVELGDLTASVARFNLESTDQSSALKGNAFKVGRLEVESATPGDVEIDSIDGRHCQFAFQSNATLNIDTVEVDSFQFSTPSYGDLNIGTLTAHESCEIDLEDENNCNVTIETLKSGATKIHSNGEGDLDIDNIGGGSFSVELLGDGGLDFDDVDLIGDFTCVQEDDGDATIGNLKAHTVLCESTANGDMTISNLEATTATMHSSGDRCIQVEDGTCDVLTLKAENDGDVTVSGEFAKLVTEKSGNGTISIN
ncbi:MAG TPA: DUF4097 family beta strand repeat-containing protein [Planktothrix sp.]